MPNAIYLFRRRPISACGGTKVTTAYARQATTGGETIAPFYAASFSFGLIPARAANRTSKSMLKRSILPRFRSDTRA